MECERVEFSYGVNVSVCFESAGRVKSRVVSITAALGGYKINVSVVCLGGAVLDAALKKAHSLRVEKMTLRVSVLIFNFKLTSRHCISFLFVFSGLLRCRSCQRWRAALTVLAGVCTRISPCCGSVWWVWCCWACCVCACAYSLDFPFPFNNMVCLLLLSTPNRITGSLHIVKNKIKRNVNKYVSIPRTS